MDVISSPRKRSRKFPLEATNIMPMMADRIRK
jgi:hypothetical protein